MKRLILCLLIALVSLTSGCLFGGSKKTVPETKPLPTAAELSAENPDKSPEASAPAKSSPVKPSQAKSQEAAKPEAQPQAQSQAKPQIQGGQVSQPQPQAKSSELQAKVEGFIEADNFPAALKAADELVAKEPKVYEHYLLRARIQSALRDYPKSIEDNEKALNVFHEKVDKYKSEEQSSRLAQIYENLAFTYLSAELNAKDQEKKKEFDKKFFEYYMKIKSLDQATFEHMSGILEDLKKK